MEVINTIFTKLRTASFKFMFGNKFYHNKVVRHVGTCVFSPI